MCSLCENHLPFDDEVLDGPKRQVCDACSREEHWNCGMQTWCSCDCDGPDGDYFYQEPDFSEDPLEPHRK